MPMGVHTLAFTVKRLCEKAGIQGYKTNHSLRVTAATRLFQSGVDKQLIMDRTGQRSTDGVRAYKRSCPEQAEQLSKVLNREMVSANKEKQALLPPSVFFSASATLDKENKDKENKPPYPSLPSITLSGCSGITINLVSKDEELVGTVTVSHSSLLTGYHNNFCVLARKNLLSAHSVPYGTAANLLSVHHTDYGTAANSAE